MGSARIRSSSADFQVDEILGFNPHGSGEHLLVQIRKHNQNTHWVAGLLAELAGINSRDVGFCGLKDRVAIATQWFSLYLPGREIHQDRLTHNAFDIIASVRHNRKLRRGMHHGYFFKIILRNVEFDRDEIEIRLKKIGKEGVPNYFAEQRFGAAGGNLLAAERLVKKGRLRGDRGGNGIYLSAARSWLFNLVLARHVENYLDGGKFPYSMTGPLWGRGRNKAENCLRAIETEVMESWPSWCHALEHSGLAQQRRELIATPRAMDYKHLDGGRFKIKFMLPKGSYATSVLRELTELIRP